MTVDNNNLKAIEKQIAALSAAAALKDALPPLEVGGRARLGSARVSASSSSSSSGKKKSKATVERELAQRIDTIRSAIQLQQQQAEQDDHEIFNEIEIATQVDALLLQMDLADDDLSAFHVVWFADMDEFRAQRDVKAYLKANRYVDDKLTKRLVDLRDKINRA